MVINLLKKNYRDSTPQNRNRKKNKNKNKTQNLNPQEQNPSDIQNKLVAIIIFNLFLWRAEEGTKIRPCRESVSDQTLDVVQLPNWRR